MDRQPKICLPTDPNGPGHQFWANTHPGLYMIDHINRQIHTLNQNAHAWPHWCRAATMLLDEVVQVVVVVEDLVHAAGDLML